MVVSNLRNRKLAPNLAPMLSFLTPRSMLATFLIVLLVCLQFPSPAHAYSVLTHEEIVDMLWNDEIKPLLLERFPDTTPDELKMAHAYAYGGSVIQDLGYYPFGSRDFSDLVHCVRSGDFVAALLDDSQDVNEFAFALGALAHYAADISGHPMVNLAVAVEFPKLAAKYKSNQITYAQNKAAHLETEFGFDMLQVAKGRYTASGYHDFIGFEVAKPLLERAFREVYGLDLKTILTHEDLTIGSYRHAVSTLIPGLTRVALVNRKDQIVKETPDFAEKKFLYHLSRADYEKEWGKEYERPGAGAKILAFFLRLIPKFGPLKALAFKVPTPKTEDMYFSSVNSTVAIYRGFLQQLRAGELKLENRDFDTGKMTALAEYPLADQSYSKLLARIEKQHFSATTPALRKNILAFYSAPASSIYQQRDGERILHNLDELKTAALPAAPAATATMSLH